jgi:hypothetical protein
LKLKSRWKFSGGFFLFYGKSKSGAQMDDRKVIDKARRLEE